MKSVTYEQPLNERIRTFLRLEFLFQQTGHTLEGSSPWDSRATLASLLDILNIFSRSDLKTEVIMELERQIANLTRLESSPDVDSEKLNKVLDEMDLLVDRLHTTQGQIGHGLRQNEFLSAIKQRSTIPGGTCDFDLPAYHYWLQKPLEKRIEDLRKWLTDFDTIKASINLILRLVRESATSTREVASAGFFQRSLDTNAPYQLIRVTLTDDQPYFAEISGGKHRFTIRFMEMNFKDRPTQTAKEVNFVLTSCLL